MSNENNSHSKRFVAESPSKERSGKVMAVSINAKQKFLESFPSKKKINRFGYKFRESFDSIIGVFKSML